MRRVDRLRGSLGTRKHWEERQRERAEGRKRQRELYEYYRKLHPRTRADFDLLFAAVESKLCWQT